VIQEALQIVLVPLELGSVKLTTLELARAYKVERKAYTRECGWRDDGEQC
jgi:hypothetical protein